MQSFIFFFGISDGRMCWLVVSLHVECQMIWPWETPVAVAAFEWLGTCMFPVVTCQLVGSGEPPLTALPRTLVRLLTCKHNTTIFSHSHIFFSNHLLTLWKANGKKNTYNFYLVIEVPDHVYVFYAYRLYFSDKDIYMIRYFCHKIEIVRVFINSIDIGIGHTRSTKRYKAILH